MKTLGLRLAAGLAAAAIVFGLASQAFAIFPLIVPQVNPEVIIDSQDPPTPTDIPNVPEIPTIPPECSCDPCGPHINNTPEPATLITAMVGVALGGAFALRKRFVK